MKIISGKKSKKGKYKQISINEMIGKKVEAIGRDTAEGAFGREPMTVILFADGTSHGFVHPAD